jgi:hypothetical protein
LAREHDRAVQGSRHALPAGGSIVGAELLAAHVWQERSMKHKVATLDGELLDDAVAKAEGVERSRAVYMRSCPSSVWEDGGPIIERERIMLEPPWHRPSIWTTPSGQWVAWMPDPTRAGGFGPTPLVSAMRAFVSAKFGEEVELP